MKEGMRFGTGYTLVQGLLGHRNAEYTRQFSIINGVTIAEAMREYGFDPDKVEGMLHGQKDQLETL